MGGTDGEANRLLTVNEVAGILKLSPYTVRRWVKMEKLPVVRLGLKSIRFEPEALDRWIRLQRPY